jgi:catechol 2,3-dioxygenase-like lactoylglutathione lyase family enzyme
MGQAVAIRRISRVVSDLRRAEAFYCEALGFKAVTRQPADQTILSALGCDDTAQEVALRLGDQTLALVQFASPGRPYPPDSRSSDLWFQHLAIVVADMEAACDHLARQPGWRPISQGGRQHLPPANGGVWAFKFRDPDGHPLELIWFPPGEGRVVWQQKPPGVEFQGIDHSALAVASTDTSLDFYRGLGFKVSNRSLNRGPAQSRLDGLPNAQVRVTALRPSCDTSPGLELLAYDPPGRSFGPAEPNDLITDWVTLAVTPGEGPRALRDPDGHRLVLVDQGAG